jgi:hypothetical protein
LFVGLKLSGVTAWSWWWVSCPLWAAYSLVLLFYFVNLPFVLVTKWRDWRDLRRLMVLT